MYAWHLSQSDRSVQDELLLANFLAGHRLDDMGSSLPLSRSELQSAWQRLRREYPKEFLVPLEQVTAWQERQIQTLVRSHLDRANNYRQLGEFENAVPHYQRVMQLSPTNAEPFNSLAWAYAVGPSNFCSPEKALPLALKAVELTGKTKYNYLNTLGVGYYRLGQLTNAIVTLVAGIKVDKAGGSAFDFFFLAMAHQRYDNDGWLDLFVNRGVSGGVGNDNALYHNNGDGTFSRVTEGSVVHDGGQGKGCAWGDYDNDGFQDLFVANGGFVVPIHNQLKFLYHNEGNGNDWLTIKLIGTASNRPAIGAKVRVLARLGGRLIWQMREISGGGNYGSQNDLRPSFGLGDAGHVDILRIEWPSGTVQEFYKVASKQFLTISEP